MPETALAEPTEADVPEPVDDPLRDLDLSSLDRLLRRHLDRTAADLEVPEADEVERIVRTLIDGGPDTAASDLFGGEALSIQRILQNLASNDIPAAAAARAAIPEELAAERRQSRVDAAGGPPDAALQQRAAEARARAEDEARREIVRAVAERIVATVAEVAERKRAKADATSKAVTASAKSRKAFTRAVEQAIAAGDGHAGNLRAAGCKLDAGDYGRYVEGLRNLLRDLKHDAELEAKRAARQSKIEAEKGETDD